MTPGERIGRYVVEGLVGSGPRGEVYRATDDRRMLALKLIRCPDAAEARRAIAGARVAATLDGVHIATVFEIGEHDGGLFVARELVMGSSVSASVSVDGRVACLAEAARTLASAHERGIVHGAVRVGNLLLQDDGTLKITDFGIAVPSGYDAAADGRAWWALASALLSSDDVPAPLRRALSAERPASLADAAALLEGSLLGSKRAFASTARPVTSDPRVPLSAPPASPYAGTIPAESRAHPSDAGASDARFVAGDLVAHRYRVERFIARGGMGEVYAALDVELGERVALKTIASDLGGPDTVKRFKRELSLARKVTHPGVCRVFDVAFHVDAAGARERRIAFITMELLEGETLGDHLAKHGALSQGEALPLVRQLADALDAAHAAGVVHRDFKCQNVILVVQGSTLRPIVTDFGLAAERRGELVTAESRFQGTPAYMAPEQVEGGALSPATDVYAFGVVLFQMVTGALPFTGASPFTVAARRLTEAPPSPRALRPDLDATWSDAILRCLARAPGERFERCGDVVAALEGGPAFPVDRRRRGRVAVAVGATMVAVLATAIGAPALRHRLGPSGATQGEGRVRRAVAVLDGHNASQRPEVQWLSTALADMLEAEIGGGDQLRAVSGEAISKATTDLGLGPDGALTESGLRLFGGRVGADVVVTGEYTALGGGAGDPLRIDLALKDARTGGTLARITETGTMGGVFALVARAGQKVRAELGIAPLTQEQTKETRATMPSSTDSARPYAEGLELARRYDYAGARAAFARAVALDPAFALAHAKLARTLTTLGADEAARAEARLASMASTPLARADQLVIEEVLHRAEKDWRKAAETMRVLFGFYPDELDYGLSLGTDLAFANDTMEASAVIARLRALPAPLGDDPRIDLVDALCAQMDHAGERELAASTRAVTRARERGERAVLAQASYHLGSALYDVGRLDDALAPLEESRATYAALGDRDGVGIATTNVAGVYMQKGDYARAEREQGDAQAIFRAVGDRMHEAWGMHSLANILRLRGDVEASQARYEGSLALFRSYGDERGAAAALGDEATLLFFEGRDEQAESLLEQARVAAERSHFNDVLRETSLALAKLHARRGELAAALHALDDAAARSTDDRPAQADVEIARAAILREKDDAAGARATIARASALRGDAATPADADAAAFHLARLALDDGDAAAAKASARAIAERARSGGRPGDATEALCLLALADRATGDGAGATEAIAQARAIAPAIPGVELRTALTVASARVDAATGDRAAATSALEALRDEARRERRVATELEAELALAEIGARTGARAAALEAVARRARGSGLARIARVAAKGGGGLP